MINFDNVLSFHTQALKLRGERSEIIANNLANVDTPGFKARDLDFKQAMQQFSGAALTMTGDNQKHISMNNEPFSLMSLKFRPTMESSLDGNTVDKDIETVAFSKNTIDYQTSLNYINGTIKGMRKAIKGE